MQVRLLTSRCDRGFEQNEGEIIEVSQAEGCELIRAGQAEPTGPEAAVTLPPEAALRPRPPKRK